VSEAKPRVRVLVVDDSPTVVTLLRSSLEAADFEVTTAADGLEALARVEERQPDVIVTDSLMPRMDGYTFVRTLRRRPTTRAIPVIMLTATDPADTRKRAAEEQPDVVVAKSFALDRVVVEIRRLTRQRDGSASPDRQMS
jgi:two-component system phosphate regulon response regulator PhoB